MHIGAEIGPRAQPRKRADAGARTDGGAFNMAVGLDLCAIGDGHAGAEEYVLGSMTTSRPILRCRRIARRFRVRSAWRPRS